VLFLKIMLVMNFDNFFYPSIFSRVFPAFTQTPAAHRLKIADWEVHEKSGVVLLIRVSEILGNTLLSRKLFTYLRTYVVFRNKLIFYGEELSAPRPYTQAGGPPLVGYPRLLIQYIRSCLPKLEGVSSIRNLRTRHSGISKIKRGNI
jgi:hypothetical protein